ncbi:hypothetical protein [Paraburkholderia terrae]|jgi:hypothetical protein|uniref:hypothetical protein n=1 Tax=Paraburkholderia terrae TaxID=311230 RepID=UPI0033653DF2
MGAFSKAPRAAGGNYRVLFIVSAAMLIIVLMDGSMAAVARASVSGVERDSAAGGQWMPIGTTRTRLSNL